MPDHDTESAAQFDPFTPVKDPYTPLAQAAAQCPVLPAPNGAVVVTGAANVSAVFKDSESFRNTLRPPRAWNTAQPGSPGR